VAGRDDTRSPDLQKLEEKFRKDPASKLFFPLAEEYLKVGRLQEAIGLLRTGIKAHPDFLSARVALGKALLNKGQTEEAKREFEQVVTANPDNLMAHKKLAAIYLKEGNKPKASSSCDVILAVNPTDAEAVRLRSQITALPDVAPEDEATIVTQVSGVTQAETEPTVVDRKLDRDESVEPTVKVVPPEDGEATVVAPSILEPTVIEPRAMVEQNALPDLAEATEVMRLDDPDLTTVAPVTAESTDGDPADDEALATTSLADLYVAQGHYQRGIAIYRRLLERAPKDKELAAKLDNALTLERLLAPQTVDAETVKTEIVHHVLAGTEPTGNEPEESLQPSLAGAVASTSPHHAAIQRLEVWLTRIAERRRR
jgi:tetratricopeptide (TPR) repeat protein